GQPGPRPRQGRLPAGDARRAAPGAGVGSDVPRLAVRPLYLRAHPRRGRRELAAAVPDQPGGRAGAGTDGAGPLHPRMTEAELADRSEVDDLLTRSATAVGTRHRDLRQSVLR